MDPSQITDYHERLGVGKNATKEELKKAYRALSMKYHPDHNPENEDWSKLEFIAIGEAYEKLNGDLEDKKESHEKGFSYYEDMFMDFQTVMSLAKEMSKSDDKKAREFGNLIYRLTQNIFR